MNFEAEVPETVTQHRSTFEKFNVIKYEGECYFNYYVLLLNKAEDQVMHNILRPLRHTKIRRFLIAIIRLVWSLYRSGTVNSNTVNSKFHLIRSFFEIFARFLSFHV